MGKSDIRKLIRYFKILYPGSKIQPDVETVGVWFDLFKDYDLLNAKKALRETGVEVAHMPGPYDILRKLTSPEFKKSLFDTYKEYPYEVSSKPRGDSIFITVTFNDFAIEFRYPKSHKERAVDLINLLKEHPTKSEIMCCWDEDMANGVYGSCRKEYGI